MLNEIIVFLQSYIWVYLIGMPISVFLFGWIKVNAGPWTFPFIVVLWPFFLPFFFGQIGREMYG